MSMQDTSEMFMLIPVGEAGQPDTNKPAVEIFHDVEGTYGCCAVSANGETRHQYRKMSLPATLRRMADLMDEIAPAKWVLNG